MHISGKIMIPIAILLLVGGGWLSSGVEEDFDEIRTNWAIDGTSGTVELYDEDGQGELGYAFFLEGEYVDENGNGLWDDCEDFNATFVSVDGGENMYVSYCDHGLAEGEPGEYRDNLDIGLILVGVACGMEDNLSCENGEYDVTTNRDVKVIYSDPAVGDAIGVGFRWLMGACGLCTGVILLVVGLLMGFLMKPKDPTATFVGNPYATPTQSVEQMPNLAPQPVATPAVVVPPVEEETPAFDVDALKFDGV